MVAWRFVRWKVAGGCFVTALLLAAIAAAQEDAEDSPFRPGLVATYAAGGQSATRVDEVVAFEWQAAAADERLPAGEFSATWRGRLWARGAGEYRLSCYVQGEVAVKLAGKTVVEGRSEQPGWLESQPIALDFDHHPIEIQYRRRAPQGQLKLFWSGPEFRLEPLPAWALVHEREKSPPAAFERGQQLAAALRCAACHKDGAAAMVAAPALDRLSGNINEAWLVDWLASHGDGNAAASARRMPDLGMNRAEAEAVAAWLLREPPVKTEAKAVEQKEAKVAKESERKSETKSKKSKGEEKPKPSAEEGEKLLLTRGCLACHQLGSLGLSGLFGGGDLTQLFQKRPEDFFARWLADPAAINRDHRMPVFQFAADEMTSLGLWAKREAAAANARRGAPGRGKDPAAVTEGKKLVESFRCVACHSLSREKSATSAPDQKELTAASDWARSCALQPRREKGQPGYRLGESDATALKAYYSAARPGAGRLSEQARGRDLLAQLNCLACHQREGVERATLAGVRAGSEMVGTAHPTLPALQDKLAAVAEAHGELATLVPAMTPPALNSVGDKLLDEALKDSITRKGRPHRPYLLAQMPRFELSKEQLAALTAYFVATDRIPSVKPGTVASSGVRAGVPRELGDSTFKAALLAAGPRLVTTDGLACASCHQVGSVLPTKAPLNARGPDMSMLGSRIRREWFDRWCNNPARIVPRMEMPAVKIPVRGVLNDNVEDQLAAVWHILNTPGFQPPEPDPVRVLRLSGIPEKNERPIVIHDVVKDTTKDGDKTYLFPIVIGLPNRHNILFDLETNRLAAWWLGDTARQRTKGKSWYWEMGGKSILPDAEGKSEIEFLIDGKTYSARSRGQFVGELASFDDRHFRYLLTLVPDQDAREANVREVYMGQSFVHTLSPHMQAPSYNFPARSGVPQPEAMLMPGGLRESGRTGFSRHIWFSSKQPFEAVRIRLASAEAAAGVRWNDKTNTLEGLSDGKLTIGISDFFRKTTWNDDGTVTLFLPQSNGALGAGIENEETPFPPKSPNNGMSWQTSFWITYSTTIPVDTFPSTMPGPATAAATLLQIAPGFEARRLPLPADIMPSGLHWMKDDLLFVTLKGQLYSAKDTNLDGSEDKLALLVDGLATPYGLNCNAESDVLVAAKDALLQLPIVPVEANVDELITGERRIAASGWGYTDDYHDWAVGLPAGQSGDFYLALPCQQDARSEAAAHLRGTIIKLVPKFNSRPLYDIEVISAGHRFPMGMARNRDGELFVTDNQGNYNPFNELNHVKKGAHFGFINALEKEKGFTPPPLTEPAINIPHPWTRSVNGICFLETPEGLRNTRNQQMFGPLEGHLVGCEYDTRRLIRMSLDKVNGEYQGCCYPLSIPPADVEKGLLGPIVCAIKPTTGELYVGEIRDSGWGASNNIGQITKIKIEPEKLPCGIAEVRATRNGFTIDFFKPVDRAKAANIDSYAIESYRRESTPAYGGPDIDRRPEKIASAKVSADGKRVTLVLPGLRTRHVYELRLKNLAPGGGVFHPDEAHYTLKQIPDGK